MQIRPVNDTTTLLHGSIAHNNSTAEYTWMRDFPDRCVVVDQGDTLKIVDEHPTDDIQFTIIGNFYDVP
jgi:hypothetical protein